MAIQAGPSIQTKTTQEMNDAINFFKLYKSLYYPTGNIVGDNEIIFCLIGYKNYLTAAYGIGVTATAAVPVTHSFTVGNVFTVNPTASYAQLIATGSGTFTFILPVVTGSGTEVNALKSNGYI